MRNLFFSLFAVSVAGVAAMMATTAMLNAPVRKAPEAAVSALAQAEPPPGSESKPASPEATVPDAPAPASGAGAAEAAGAATPEAKAAEAGDADGDKDPYEGIAPEELPPDLQYSADSSVSFPTNI